MQLRRSRLKFSRLNHIFISHLHGDHCFGLLGLISTFGLLGQRADVKAIRVGASKCIIEARFDISAYGMQPFFEENELEYEEECLLRPSRISTSVIPPS